MPTTYAEAMQKSLQQVVAAMTAPDADLDELSKLQEYILGIIRKPVDTPTKGSPIQAGMDLSTGATPGSASPSASPMMQALMAMGGGGEGGPVPTSGAPAGSFPTRGLMASPSPAPPPDELRRILHPG